MNKNSEYIIDRLVRIRKEKKISQGKLAELLNTNQPEISSIERKLRNLRLDRATRWANALGYILTLKDKSEL